MMFYEGSRNGGRAEELKGPGRANGPKSGEEPMTTGVLLS